ncbi:reverse transcriptase domain-containing protein [Tanacetum coccineum]
MEKEKGIEGGEVAKGNVMKLNELEALEPIESPDKEEDMEEGTDSRSIESMKEELIGMGTKSEALVETPRLTDKEPVETDVRLSLSSHSYIYPLGIAKDVWIDIASYVYLIDFVILYIKEDKNKPFILGTQFLTTAKAVIRFEKGMITLKSGKNKIDFVKVPTLPSESEKSVEDDLDPITPTNTVSKLILEWEERIKYHQEKEMEFNQWRSMMFDNKVSIYENKGCEVRNEGGVTKRISDKRTKNQVKNDKTEHRMEKRGKDKVKSNPKSTVKTGADTKEYLMGPPEPI